MTAPLLLWTFCAFFGETTPELPRVLIVVGAAGAPEYEETFREWSHKWRDAATRAGAQVTILDETTRTSVTDRERLQTFLAESTEQAAPLWLVLIGHGTFDRRDAKFNLVGPDVSSVELKEWLQPLKCPVAILDVSSASAPFVTHLSAPGRVILSATKSGSEQNFARLGGYLSEAWTETSADLDKDEQISLLEAFLHASRRTAEFYKTEGRLQTEHALLDDNGDGQGTRAEAYQGLQPVQRSQDSSRQLDGAVAHRWHLLPSPREQELSPEARQARQRLDEQIASLRRQKSSLPEDVYYARLEDLLVQLARLAPAE